MPYKGESRGFLRAWPTEKQLHLSHSFNTPQAKCDVHRIDVNAINNEKRTFAVYRIFVMCDVHRI